MLSVVLTAARAATVARKSPCKKLCAMLKPYLHGHNITILRIITITVAMLKVGVIIWDVCAPPNRC